MREIHDSPLSVDRSKSELTHPKDSSLPAADSCGPYALANDVNSATTSKANPGERAWIRTNGPVKGHSQTSISARSLLLKAQHHHTPSWQQVGVVYRDMVTMGLFMGLIGLLVLLWRLLLSWPTCTIMEPGASQWRVALQGDTSHCSHTQQVLQHVDDAIWTVGCCAVLC